MLFDVIELQNTFFIIFNIDEEESTLVLSPTNESKIGSYDQIAIFTLNIFIRNSSVKLFI